MKSEPTLHYLANVLADWADQIPLSKVYIFGSRARGDARPESDLDVAVTFDVHVSDEVVDNWICENERDFSDLKTKLGVKLSLHANVDDAVWPAIRRAEKDPVLSIRKVVAVATPRRT